MPDSNVQLPDIDPRYCGRNVGKHWETSEFLPGNDPEVQPSRLGEKRVRLFRNRQVSWMSVCLCLPQTPEQRLWDSGRRLVAGAICDVTFSLFSVVGGWQR